MRFSAGFAGRIGGGDTELTLLPPRDEDMTAADMAETAAERLRHPRNTSMGIVLFVDETSSVHETRLARLHR